MAQDVLASSSTSAPHGDEHSHGTMLLGPLLCWAVVFADIGTSIYYVPGILYGNVGNLAGFFVLLTMSVFVLLTLKYSEVTHRYPQGGGVVTVAASAMNKWFGALGGMFILVDYFLTASISSLSGMQYLSVVLPVLGVTVSLPLFGAIQFPLLAITIVVLILLGLLNWVGVSESAKVSLVGAVIAFVSDLAILVTVFIHIPFRTFLSLFPEMFAHNSLTPISLLIGFAGSFLAFSGLESISQLSPVMRVPRKRTAGIALLLVVITIGLTSPLLTMFSTLLQPREAADYVLSSQLISLLGGHWGNTILQTEIAISASALLIFASNTAIIGAYHVFIALARLGFFPELVMKRNKLRNTPHNAIILATIIPIVILVLVLGDIVTLGDMYAFGLLGAFTLTCLGLDIVRSRDRREERSRRQPGNALSSLVTNDVSALRLVDNPLPGDEMVVANGQAAVGSALSQRIKAWWRSLDFWLGVLTTGLVMVAWGTNLVAKPLATVFGVTVTVVGMAIAYVHYSRQERRGQIPVQIAPLSSIGLMKGATLALLLPMEDKANTTIMHAAMSQADGKPLAFLYIGRPQRTAPLQPFEVYDPYLADEYAIKTLRKAETYMREEKPQTTPTFFYYPVQPPAKEKETEIVRNIWRAMHPHELLMAAKDVEMLEDINPDRIRYEITPKGKVAHLLAR
jgi:amino acid transporter